MRHTKWITIFLIACGVTTYAQEQGKRQPPDPVKQNQTGNTQNPDTDAGESTADTPGAAEASSNANNTNQGGSSGDQRASNTPAVPQTTSSNSGSPAVLSEDNGKGRDGTNNVQRASMNMVGSPATNLGLDQVEVRDADSEMADRQGYTQDKQKSAQNRSSETGGNPSSGESGEINNKNRRENYEQSDQNLSAKEKRNDDQDESESKSKRKKERRNH